MPQAAGEEKRGTKNDPPWTTTVVSGAEQGAGGGLTPSEVREGFSEVETFRRCGREPARSGIRERAFPAEGTT